MSQIQILPPTRWNGIIVGITQGHRPVKPCLPERLFGRPPRLAPNADGKAGAKGKMGLFVWIAVSEGGNAAGLRQFNRRAPACKPLVYRGAKTAHVPAVLNLSAI